MRSCLAISVSVLAAILLAGCASNDTGVAQQALSSALQRADDHKAAAASAPDPGSLRRETQAYDRDMHGMLDDMTAACEGMMGSMHAGANMNMGELTQTADAASTAVDQHRDRMMQLNDLQQMRKECSEHSQAMTGMLGNMRTTMSRGGMMGAGGMM
ncbi:MAG TPA: hypothetical protein VF331_27570 [Polyangiales bacterium]